jgi:flagellar hook-associated protein 3 FlgL
MRVTDRMMFERATREGGKAKEALDLATQRLSTGARFSHPGEDPAAAALVALARARAERLDAVSRAAARASDELVTADAALSEVTAGLARARELAVQLSASTYAASERAAAAKEVRGVLSAAVASLNVKVGNRFLFGGTADAAPPFDASVPGTVTYAGDAGVREVEIAPGVRQAASVRADVALKGAGGGTDVLATLEALAAALEANDPAAIRGTLDPLATGTDQLARARGELGALMATFDAAVAAGEAGRDDARIEAAHLSDADPIAAAKDLAFAQRALEAALTATAKGFQLTLLDKLG